MNEIMIADIPHGSQGDVIRITVNDKGTHVQIRDWFRAPGGELRPGYAGIRLPLSRLNDVVEALKGFKP